VATGGEVDVLCISGTAHDTLRPINTPARVRDLDEGRTRRRDREILALDEDERFVDLALELLAALDDPRHQRFRFPAFTPAETMFGYAPQRQRFPATARRTSSSVGAGVSRNKATTDMIWPGVQKPHWNASASMNARCTGCSPFSPSPDASFVSPSIVSTCLPSHAIASVMHA